MDNRTNSVRVLPYHYLHILLGNTSKIKTVVGPKALTVADADSVLRWNQYDSKYEVVTNSYQEAIVPFVQADQGQYILLKNPVKDDEAIHPITEQEIEGGSTLAKGEYQIIEGPDGFALWPYQEADVIDAHMLRHDQYLWIEITNSEEALANWNYDFKPWQVSEVEEESIPKVGERYRISGRMTPHFVPVTGTIVVYDENSHQYIHDGLVLEALEWGIVVSASGEKRYEYGPKIVFPDRFEDRFEMFNGKSVFRSLELTATTGIHVKALASHTDEQGVEWKEGQEAFITGKDRPFFFPTDKLVVIAYGNRVIQYAITIPKGSARYVLNKETGEVSLVKGHKMHLPDPTREIYIQRNLTEAQKRLWFPGYNNIQDDIEFADTDLKKSNEQVRAFGAETLARMTSGTTSPFAPPRSMMLEPSAEDAIRIDVRNGFAALISNGVGEQRVVIGPSSTFLEYDEDLVSFEVSSGTPKQHTRTRQEVYLKLDNRVTDQITITTSDQIGVHVSLVYRVTFNEETSASWFKVPNYIELLTQSMYLAIANKVRNVRLQDFMTDPSFTILPAVLGEDLTGTSFDENGMKVSEVHVVGVEVSDSTIAREVQTRRQEITTAVLALQMEEANKDVEERREAIKQSLVKARQKTADAEHAVSLKMHKNQFELEEIQSKAQKAQAEANQAILDFIAHAELNREQTLVQMRQQLNETDIQQSITKINAEVEAEVTRLQAIGTDQWAIMERIVSEEMVAKLSEHLGGMSMLGDTDVLSLALRAFKGTSIGTVLEQATTYNHKNE